MSQHEYLDEMEADVAGWGLSDMSFYGQANKYSHQPASLAEQVQAQHPSQLPQAPIDRFFEQLQDDPFALPTLENEAWTAYLNDAHLWQPGDSFLSFAQRRGPLAMGLPLPIRNSERSWGSEHYAPYETGPGVDNAVDVPPPQPPRQLTEVTKQVISEIITRLNARGASIDKDLLTAQDAEQIIAVYATPTEKTFLREGQQAYSPSQVQHSSYQPAEPTEVDLEGQSDQADTTTQQDPGNANHRRQRYPARLPDGRANTFHNKHNRPHFRSSCFPCYSSKRKCDRTQHPNSICSQCVHQAELFPDIFDPSIICVIDETEEYRDFKEIRATETSKVKQLGDDDWLAKRQAKQEKKAEKKETRPR